MATRKVFVIMPFVTANGRDQGSLTRFFENYLKHPIETNTRLSYKYSVNRSGNSFLILDKIIEDIAAADVVICDLSGEFANPNVMFELGLRFATSSKPTILIRENAASNKKIFDISGLYAHHYSIDETRELETYLIGKLLEYEENHELYESPVLKILDHRAAFWMTLPVRKASAFLGGIASATEACLQMFSRALIRHLQLKGKDPIVGDASVIYKTLNSLEEPSIVDDFDYKITSIPSLDSYLSSVYLLGLVEDDVERKFREYVMAYSLYFNRGNSALFSVNKFEEYLAYAIETLILMNAARLVIQILDKRQGATERTQLVQKFFTNIEKSSLSEKEK